jgi:beta-lactamase class D
MKAFNYTLGFCILLLGSCTINNLKVDKELKPLFDKYQVRGTFALLDNAQADFTIYDTSVYRKRFCPASTFKIVNSLIGLETGRIFDEKMVIPWDGVQRGFPNWNKDLTMAEAFEYSSVPYYQEVARRIGRDTMQYWIDTISYGNKNISGPIDSFWLNNTLQISPDEQLGLVKRLYFGQLPFQKRTQDIVKKVMLRESNTLYQLSYKTGWTRSVPGQNLGWVVGWIEENRHPYFFVLLVQSDDPSYDMMTKREQLLKEILRHYGFLEGKK